MKVKSNLTFIYLFYFLFHLPTPLQPPFSNHYRLSLFRLASRVQSCPRWRLQAPVLHSTLYTPFPYQNTVLLLMIAGFVWRVESILNLFLESSKNVSIFLRYVRKSRLTWNHFSSTWSDLYKPERNCLCQPQKSQSIFCRRYWWQ